MKNQAVIMKGIRQLTLEDAPMPDVGPQDVLIRVEHVGICGSDVHYYEHGRIGSIIVRPPFILGHECAGTIVEKGKGVDNLAPGDRVAIEPGVTCGRCEYCKQGKYNLCPSVEFLATPPIDGALQKYISFPRHMVFKLPQNVSTLEGALVEPLSVGLHAAKQAHAAMGKSVLILGVGCIGMMTLIACKAMGASRVIVSDIFEGRLAKAKELGASEAIHAKNEDTVQAIREHTKGAGVDIVIETAGTEATIAQTVKLVKRGGTVVLVGYPPKESVSLDVIELINKEATVKTVFRYRNIYPDAVEAIRTGQIGVLPIVSKTFAFVDSMAAFDYVTEHKKDVLKAIIQVDENAQNPAALQTAGKTRKRATHARFRTSRTRKS